MTELRHNPENLYVELTKPERFFWMVPMMFNDKQGNEVKLPMVVLTSREEKEAKQNAYNETVAHFKTMPKSDEASIFNDLMDHNQACWTFFFATRIPGQMDKKFFQSKQQVEDQYTTAQLGILSNAYLSVQLNQPWVKHLNVGDTDSFEKLIEDIIRAGTEHDFLLNGFTTHSLKQLIHYLIAHQKTSELDNGSSGMQ